MFRFFVSVLSILLLMLLFTTACGGGEEATITVPAPTIEQAEPTQSAEAEPKAAQPEPTKEQVAKGCEPAKDGPLAGIDPHGLTIDWWHQHSREREERLLEMVGEFNATNPCGIAVNATNQGDYNDIRDKMNAGLATGDLPALVVGYQNDQAFYALADGLADLNTYIDDSTWGLTPEDRASFYGNFLNQGIHRAFGGQRLGFPPNRSIEGLFYNMTWLKELGFDGPPTTPQQFHDMACAAADANGDGTGGYILSSDASALAAWTFAFGGDVLTKDGTGYVYNGPATVEALTFLKSLFDDGCAYFFTEGDPNPEFASRRAIFTQGSSSGLPFYTSDVATVAEETGREPDQWGFTAIPYTTSAPVVDIYGADIMIPATTPEQQLAAWTFIKWFTTPEVQAQWVRASNYFPTRRDTTDFLGDYIDENPQWGQALLLLQYGQFEPQLISYQGTRDAAEQAFNEIMQGADVQSTMDNSDPGSQRAPSGSAWRRLGLPLIAQECEPATDGPLAGIDPHGLTIDWWHQHSREREERLLEMVGEFNATNPCGIAVNATNQGDYNDIRDKMNAGLATGDLPALVVGYQNDQAFYALADGLADLNTYIDDSTWGLTPEDRADFYENFLDQGVHPSYDDQRLGFPPNRSIEGLFYNMTWLKELGFDGPPTTPQQFHDMACAAADANGDGTGGYILSSDASALAAWTFAFGGDVLTKDGTGYVYNGPATVEALTFLKSLFDDGCAYFFTEGDPNPEFASRRAIFTQGSSSGLPFYTSDVATVAEETGREPDQWGFTAIPYTTSAPVVDIYGADVMIPATTPEQQLAAWTFIKWFTTPDVQAQWVRASNYFPTRGTTRDFLGDYISENPQWGQALSLLQYGQFEPQLISYQGTRDAAEQAFNEVMQGADVQSTLDDLTQEANKLQADLMEE